MKILKTTLAFFLAITFASSVHAGNIGWELYNESDLTNAEL